MMPYMAAKKVVRRGTKSRPDKYSKKRSGMVAQSLRLTVQENKLLRKAAGALSFNLWATQVLIDAANQILASQQPTDETGK